MCLAALALGLHPRFPLVVAANRDEYHERPALPLSWWSPGANLPPVLGGRDLLGGGTWMGLTARGRLAFLTNIRAGAGPDPAAPSRGQIVADWLTRDDSADAYCERLAAQAFRGYNLVAADLSRREWFWTSSANRAALALAPGLHGLSNAALDTPWPKVVELKARVAAALARASSIETLIDDLFAALADRVPASEHDLPDTGVPLDIERALSSAFVDMPQRRYGTRCSTLLIRERGAALDRTHMLELGFDAQGATTRLHRTVLDGWPPAAPGEVMQSAPPQPAVCATVLRASP